MNARKLGELAALGCALAWAACGSNALQPQAAEPPGSTEARPPKGPGSSAAPATPANAPAAQLGTPSTAATAAPAGAAKAPADDTAPGVPLAAPQGPIDAQHARVAEVLRYDPADPLADLEKADALDRGAAPKRAIVVDVPKRGCALAVGPRRIWPATGIASVTALDDDFVVAGYVRDAQGERLFVVQLTAEGAAQPVASLRVEPPHPTASVAAPGLAADGAQGVMLAYSNGAGTLFMQHLQVGDKHGAGSSLEIARNVDTRFAPAVAYGKRVGLIAYTLGVTPMRSMLARIGPKGDLLDSHDITPEAMGAAAPAFVQGATVPTLVTADARNGLSPIARTVLAEDGTPRGSQVAAPVGMMSQPPQLTAAEASFGAYVGYTGLGSAATSAVGLVQIAPKSGSPEALVKGVAYGPLHVAAVASRDVLVFAADTPKAPGKSPQHTLVLTPVDAEGRGKPLVIDSPTGDATKVALTRGAGGKLGLVFDGGDAIYFVEARCDEH